MRALCLLLAALALARTPRPQDISVHDIRADLPARALAQPRVDDRRGAQRRPARRAGSTAPASARRTMSSFSARGFKKGAKTWSEPFVLADTPGYPDTNATMFIDPRQRLWLLWPTILANEWHTALMKYRISSDYQREGAPRWDVSEVLHVTPGDEFKTTVDRELDRLDGERHTRRSPPAVRREAAARRGRQAGAASRLDDARAPVRARRHAADRAALFGRLQLFADGDHRRLGRDAGRPARRSSASATSSRRWRGRRTARWSPTCATTALRPSGCTSADRAIAARPGARSRTRRSRIRAPARKCACSPTATGSSSTTISSRAATAWPCRSRRTRARRGRGRVISSAGCRPPTRRVSLSVDHSGARRHAARQLQLFHSAGAGEERRAGPPDSQGDQARALQRSMGARSALTALTRGKSGDLEIWRFGDDLEIWKFAKSPNRQIAKRQSPNRQIYSKSPDLQISIYRLQTL